MYRSPCVQRDRLRSTEKFLLLYNVGSGSATRVTGVSPKTTESVRRLSGTPFCWAGAPGYLPARAVK